VIAAGRVHAAKPKRTTPQLRIASGFGAQDLQLRRRAVERVRSGADALGERITDGTTTPMQNSDGPSRGYSMRPGQNKRIRGRSNRKGPNPLTRSYESNGPDVKIRGTAQHIAEKYLQLARDAQSSGDTIMAESLLQHAEHYFRLIAAAQSAQQQGGYGRSFEAETDAGEEEDDLGGIPDRFAPLSERLPQPAAYQPQPYAPAYQPQPPAQQPHFNPPPQFGQQPQPYEERPIGDRSVAEPRYERQPRQDRGFRGRDRDRGEGGERGERQGFERNRENRRFQPRPQPAAAQEEPAGSTALPSFITAPIRATVPEENADSFTRAERTAVREHEEAAAGFHLNSRRRRRPRAGAEEANGAVASTGEEPAAHSGELPLGD
jgi:hypothetical protein